MKTENIKITSTNQTGYFLLGSSRSLTIAFPEKPSDEILSGLKKLGFTYNGNWTCTMKDTNTIADAIKLSRNAIPYAPLINETVFQKEIINAKEDLGWNGQYGIFGTHVIYREENGKKIGTKAIAVLDIEPVKYSRFGKYNEGSPESKWINAKKAADNFKF